MSDFSPPLLETPRKLAAACESICREPEALARLEHLACTGGFREISLLNSVVWKSFSAKLRRLYEAHDHLIIKDWPLAKDGETLLLASLAIGSMLRTYRGGRIVKHFKMSPWTTELSHTTREGEFHTDLNTEPNPPPITAMQCLNPDPGRPAYGMNRVARLVNLLAFLEKNRDVGTLRFLKEAVVTMLNDRSASAWTGQIVKGEFIRYHPETLRAAARRLGNANSELQDRISRIAHAAFAASCPFFLEKGDILLLSNHRTLHYRGPCSVVFERYPTEFISRSVFIIHAEGELKAS